MTLTRLNQLRLRCEFLREEDLVDTLQKLLTLSETAKTLFRNFTVGHNYLGTMGHPTFSFQRIRGKHYVLGEARRRTLASYCQWLLTPVGLQVFPATLLYLSELASWSGAFGQVSVPTEAASPTARRYCAFGRGSMHTPLEVRSFIKLATLLRQLKIYDLDHAPAPIKAWPLTIYEGSQL